LLRRSSKRLGVTLRRRAISQVRTQAAPGYVIPVEISRRPTVRKADFKAAAPGHSFMGNDPDAIGHPP